MKLLMTGATGFIGKALCEALSREGHELVVITRNPIRARSLIPAPHKAIQWDFADAQQPSNLAEIHDIDAVIHLAGESILGKRWNSKFKDQLYHSRVSYTRNLISLLKSNCRKFPKLFITASAVGIYGNRGNEVLNETSPPGNDFLAHLCQDWEKALFEQATETTRKIALRIGIVLGKGGGALAQMIDPYSLGLGGPLGDGSQWMSWIHIEDLVSIVLESLKNDQLSGPINCCAPQPITNRKFTEDLAKYLNTRTFISIPKLALKVTLGEGSMALLSSQRVTPAQLLKANFPFKYSNLDSALRAILRESYSQGCSEFQQKCWLPLSIQEVFQFFSNAKNLEKITPPWLCFHILSQSSAEMKVGTIIDYRLKLHGVPMVWRTEISSWNPPYEFSDIQLKGPYEIWNHTHRFSKVGSGTLMEDQVLYKIPMGFLGRLFAGSYVKRDVSKIFRYRNTKIYDLLIEKGESTSKWSSS